MGGASGKTILVLGGGIGGVACATRLRRHLGSAHRVVVVERDESYVYSPSTLWLMVGGRTQAQVTRSHDALGHKGIELVKGTVEVIDPAARSARVNGRTYQCDYLVVALGAELLPQRQRPACSPMPRPTLSPTTSCTRSPARARPAGSQAKAPASSRQAMEKPATVTAIFYAEPAPRVRLRQPSRVLHLGKVLYEKYWLGRWF